MCQPDASSRFNMDIGTAHDHASRRRAKPAISRQKNPLRRSPLFSSIPPWHPDTYFLLSDAGVFLDYRAPHFESPAVAPGELHSRHLSEVFPPEVSRMYLAALARARKGRTAVELHYSLDVSGDERHYEVRFISLPDGKCACIVRGALCRARPGGMTQEIQQLRDQLAHSARISLMGKLTASLVHEVNQPVAAIVANASTASRLLSSDPDTAWQEFPAIISDIIRCGARARHMIDRLRHFGSKREPCPEQVNMSGVVEEATLLARSELALRCVRLDLQLSRHLPCVIADRVEMLQVILNLLVNAADAASAACSQEGVVKVRTRHRRGSVEVRVDDNGAGIPSHDLTRVFEPFFSTKKNGMGLGLAICANIVGAAGGQLTAGNVRGGGASFKVSLPAVHRAGSLEGGRGRAKTPRVVSQRGLRELVTPTTSVP
jgi:signal transduction histidine kinase